jgi:hypothetical protein
MESPAPPATDRIARLPTLTTTPAVSTTAPSAVEAPLAPAVSADAPPAAAPLPPVESPTPIPIPTAYSGGWVFFGVRNFPDQAAGGLHLYGDVLNDSGATVEVSNITGTFYDELGQVVADGNTTGQWPTSTIPPGGRVPFGLIVPGLQSADSFDLRVEAQPSSQTPRQDFEFLEVAQSAEGSSYCLMGKLSNPGEVLNSYLITAAILFDGEDKVINYINFYEAASANLTPDQPKDFNICVDTLNQPVARYELRAWGQ